ncbi:DNA polymerase III subunit beta [Agrobacterium tumefaciens]|uniref:DNA polymerase III subunit beta n=1 Tax=Agrobacterium tumefaciens TaxID=358 RepID=UPI0015741CBF|nr:DNA polymerase III subunit beta [Agrobacterium tumefaciens]NTD85462.1 DNA polymerase III subunit beta [Agrobacterium tumefaciens]NTD90811.1 DNA polymerase III subunit beta [Agrobacterium tumefaciens]NTD96392.1 DNA polymerase III subunit beta [Agrobacterium tumefaciens]NTE15885.1 DNA polymerase III subunit beta [Agrobacterium tumefaciens]NTE23126.1 DNA polymerase III subunit beta [Agrobacterium tumefaciens]
MLAAAQAHSISPSASLEYSVFKKAILNACKVVEKKNTIPVLDTVLITSVRGGCHVFGTDLDLCTTTFVPGSSHPDFVAVIDAHKLRGVMDRVTEAASISFVREDEKLLVTIGKVNLTLTQDIPRKDFPEDLSYRAKLKTSNASFAIPSSTLATILQKVRFAISTEETRYYLNGVLMHLDEHDKNLAFVATDGHKLARYQIDIPPGAEAAPAFSIIPRKTVEEVYRMVSRKGCPEQTQITVTDTAVSFRIGEDELLESKLVDGTFPDYRRVIPTRNEHKVAIRTEGFITALKQATAIKSEKDKSAKLTFSPNKVVITCRDVDFGSASTELVAFHDVTLELGMNANYLGAVLNQLDGGAMLEMQAAGDPVIIKDGADDGVTYVLMPLRA